MTPEKAFSKLPRSPLPPIQNATSVFAYKDPRVTKLIWNIKYKKHKTAVEIGGYALYQELITLRRNVPDKPFLVLPMPITPRRRRERGFNQCELLAEELARLDKDKLFTFSNSILLRIQHASRQTLKGRTERLESAKGIFSVASETDILKESQVVIIDDVITTGSTIKEAMETLDKAGFNSVRGLSLAH